MFRARQQAGADRLERSGSWPKLRGKAGHGVSRLILREKLTLTCRGLREDELVEVEAITVAD